MSDGIKRIQHIVRLSQDVNALMEKGSPMFVRRGTIFVHAGNPADYCYIIKSGKAVSVEIYENGNVRNGLVMQAGTIIGEACVLLDEPCPVSFKAIEDCELVRIKREDMKKHLEENPALYKVVVESLAQKFLSGMEELRQMAGYSATWRICNLLLSFAACYGREVDGRVCIETSISQQKIGWLLYLNRITVVRAIKMLKEMGLIDYIDGFYYINDMGTFKGYMEKLACEELL